MAELISGIFDKTLALLNKYSEDGVRIPEADTIDLQMKFIPIIDMGHKELFESARIDLEQKEPTTITAITDTTEVNYKADIALVYCGAARLAFFKKKELVQFFEDEWIRLRSKCANKATEVAITDVYGFNTGR